ncbi:adenylate/guanylate cyclase domain-containing protein [Roseospira visakhapatnamensis]|uniref:Class 3 adenylate cyclase/HAMP domain-containing protein n=1 Tax=Roseospira visakhapatnamensis TaxID=390880 RepID=A0A7W6RAF4_9PROT|nr:adenylate/guanylate cyclase domain-containing protein [Roseospira visakhapatnamensis]MBB4264717.1 class 3 adenylate cyclase/HAMP domain-containing protein [Roseospira visakhapatnamensis]
MLRRFSVSLRVILALGFSGLVALSTGTVVGFNFWSSGSAADDLMEQRTVAVMHALEGWLQGQLRPMETVVRNAQAVVHNGGLDPTNPAALDGYVRGILAGTPRLEVVAVVTPDNRARRYGRDSDPVTEDWSERPNVVSMLEALAARARAGETDPVWGKPLWRGNGGHAAFNVRAPLVRDGAPVGTLIAMIGLGPITEALPASLTTDMLTPYVLYDRTAVLAHPLLDGDTLRTDDAANAAQPLLDVTSFPDLHLATLWSGEEMDLRNPVDLQPGWVRGVRLPDEEVIHTLREVTDFTPAPLLMGTHFTVEEGAFAYVQQWRAIFTGLVVLVLAVVAALLLGGWIGRPITRFSALARAVAAGDLSQDPPNTPTLIREFRDGRVAWRGMLAGLRERERIRDLFGKYVPEEVARRLLAQGDPMPVDHAEATVLFADLAGFSSLTHALGPDHVVRVLNAFFSAMVAILEHHGGMVTQFQGDGMLVVFNLPEPHPDHATAAVLAALAMQRRLDQGPIAGHDLRCRIGIGTGPAVAGAVGAEGRLTYTVHGDAVNLAARLESLNKTTGTRILLSDRTAALAPSLPYMSLGKLPVRGQGVDARVFTPADDTPPDARTEETGRP